MIIIHKKERKGDINRIKGCHARSKSTKSVKLSVLIECGFSILRQNKLNKDLIYQGHAEGAISLKWDTYIN